MKSCAHCSRKITDWVAVCSHCGHPTLVFTNLDHCFPRPLDFCQTLLNQQGNRTPAYTLTRPKKEQPVSLEEEETKPDVAAHTSSSPLAKASPHVDPQKIAQKIETENESEDKKQLEESVYREIKEMEESYFGLMDSTGQERDDSTYLGLGEKNLDEESVAEDQQKTTVLGMEESPAEFLPPQKPSVTSLQQAEPKATPLYVVFDEPPSSQKEYEILGFSEGDEKGDGELIFPEESLETVSEENKARVLELLREKKFLEAIGLLRENTALNFNQAKQLLINLGKEQKIKVPSRLSGVAEKLSLRQRKEIRQILQLGRTLEAIYLLRRLTGLGLKEGREEIERMCAESNIPFSAVQKDAVPRSWSKILRNIRQLRKNLERRAAGAAEKLPRRNVLLLLAALVLLFALAILCWRKFV